MRLEDYADMMKQAIYSERMNLIKSFNNKSFDSGRPLSALPDYRLDKFDLYGNKKSNFAPSHKKLE